MGELIMDNYYITDEEAKKQLESGYGEAEKILNDPDKLEKFLQRLEKKLETVPLVGKKLSHVPAMVSLIKSYARKEYTKLPLGTGFAIVSALIYFLSPIDLIPDVLPGLGHIDDALVIEICWNFVEDDVEEYMRWREANGFVVE